MALCKAYRPYRGLGSDVPSRCAWTTATASASPAGKRKADAVGHPEAPSRARRRQLRGTNEDDDDAMSFAKILESELLSYFGTENSPGVGEPAAPEYQDKPSAAMPQQDPASDDDDDDVMEISLDEFLGSSAAHAVPPRAAQPGSVAATDGDVIEFSHEKLTIASSPERSSTPSALTDDDDMCGLACPPMDDAYVELIFSEPLLQFDPTVIEEFISDL